MNQLLSQAKKPRLFGQAGDAEGAGLVLQASHGAGQVHVHDALSSTQPLPEQTFFLAHFFGLGLHPQRDRPASSAIISSSLMTVTASSSSSPFERKLLRDRDLDLFRAQNDVYITDFRSQALLSYVTNNLTSIHATRGSVIL